MKWMERLKLMRISKWAILILAIAIVIFTVVTIYGLNIGNFIISVKDANDRGDVNLVLSQYEDFSAKTPVLSAQGLREQADTTLSAIEEPEKLVKGIGAKNDEVFKRYMAFSFYLINQSEGEVDYNYTFYIKEDSAKIVKVLRVWIIESNLDDTITHGRRNIYAEPEPTEELQAEYEHNIGPVEYYETIPFVSAGQTVASGKDYEVCTQERKNFEKDGVTKFTVVLWLEGHDPLCSNDLLDSTLKCSMDFVAVLD